MPLVTVEDTITLLRINKLPHYFAKSIATLFLKITKLSPAYFVITKNAYLTNTVSFLKR